MPFQANINYDFAFGVVGEVVKDGPMRVKPGLIQTTVPANNVFGRAFTQAPAGGTVAAGGTGNFVGLLSNPKQHASFGGTLGPLSPSFALPNQTIASFLTMGYIVVQLKTAANIGDLITYSIAVE